MSQSTTPPLLSPDLFSLLNGWQRWDLRGPGLGRRTRPTLRQPDSERLIVRLLLKILIKNYGQGKEC